MQYGIIFLFIRRLQKLIPDRVRGISGCGTQHCAVSLTQLFSEKIGILHFMDKISQTYNR